MRLVEGGCARLWIDGVERGLTGVKGSGVKGFHMKAYRMNYQEYGSRFLGYLWHMAYGASNRLQNDVDNHSEPLYDRA